MGERIGSFIPPDPNVVRQLMSRHFNVEHGVVDLRRVIDGLDGGGRDPVSEFRAILEEPREVTIPNRDDLYAVMGLRALADRLGPDDGSFLMAQTRRLADSSMVLFDDAGYYETIRALATSG